MAYSSELLLEFSTCFVVGGGSKIDNLDFRVGVFSFKNDVFRFEISVNEIVFVQVQNSTQNLLHDVTSHFFSESLTIHDSIEQFSSFKILSDNEEIFVVLVEFQHFDDIWMVLMEVRIYCWCWTLYLHSFYTPRSIYSRKTLNIVWWNEPVEIWYWCLQDF